MKWKSILKVLQEDPYVICVPEKKICHKKMLIAQSKGQQGEQPNWIQFQIGQIDPTGEHMANSPKQQKKQV